MPDFGQNFTWLPNLVHSLRNSFDGKEILPLHIIEKRTQTTTYYPESQTWRAARSVWTVVLLLMLVAHKNGFVCNLMGGFPLKVWIALQPNPVAHGLLRAFVGSTLSPLINVSQPRAAIPKNESTFSFWLA